MKEIRTIKDGQEKQQKKGLVEIIQESKNKKIGTTCEGTLRSQANITSCPDLNLPKRRTKPMFELINEIYDLDNFESQESNLWAEEKNGKQLEYGDKMLDESKEKIDVKADGQVNSVLDGLLDLVQESDEDSDTSTQLSLR